MEWAALVIAVLTLIAQGVLWWRFLRQDIHAPQQQIGFPVFKANKACKRPRVRDELAAWRQEQAEKYEWEAELKSKEDRR